MKTLLIGLDAAAPQVVADRIAAGSIPNMQAVFDDGVSAPLRSQTPPWTASAWPSLYTGVNPGKHGVFDFLQFDGYDWDVVNRTRVREHAIWELLSEHGLSSVVVNVPVTDPPLPFDGALIPGYVAPDPPTCHPEGLLDEVREAIGGYDVYNPNSRETREGRIEGYETVTRQRGAAFRYLAERFDPDFGFIEFQQTDSVFHEFGDDEAAHAVYAAVDEEVGAIIEQCAPENVFIVSDHGIGPYAGYEFRVNEFLRTHGYVETAQGGRGMPSWTAVARKRLFAEEKGEETAPSKPHPMARVMRLAAKAGLTSQRAAALLRRVGLEEFVARRVPKDAIRASTEQVDFERSTAYMRSRVEMGIRINLEGREPSGVVSPDEYDAVREELMELLRGVETPDGEPMFESVRTREEVFSGPYVEEVSDIIVVPTDYEHTMTTSLLGAAFEPLDGIYEHKRDGVIAATGAAVDTETSLEGAHLFDVAPTVLASLGVPMSDRMDGTVLSIVDDAGRDRYPPFVGDEEKLTADVSVEQRLADIGYLE